MSIYSPSVLWKEVPLCSHVFEYLQDSLSLLIRQVFHGSPLLLFFHIVVICLLSPLLFFIALLQVLRYFSIILQTGTKKFRQDLRIEPIDKRVVIDLLTLVCNSTIYP